MRHGIVTIIKRLLLKNYLKKGKSSKEFGNEFSSGVGAVQCKIIPCWTNANLTKCLAFPLIYDIETEVLL